MARWRRIRAGYLTREVVSWSIGIVVVLVVTLMIAWVSQQLGWSWP